MEDLDGSAVTTEAMHEEIHGHDEWTEPKNVRYREISGWPHLNDCIQTLELLNIGGTNVLGEFIPFILLYAPQLKSLGQWINTMIYGKIGLFYRIFCSTYHSVLELI